jgi:hypothetical protein
MRAFARCFVRTSSDRQLVESRDVSRFEMALREGAARAGLRVTLEGDGSGLSRELDDDVKLPRSA